MYALDLKMYTYQWKVLKNFIWILNVFRNPKMGEVSVPKDKDKTHDTPTQSSPKTNEGDRDFISKVLKDFNFPHDHGVLFLIDEGMLVLVSLVQPPF